MGLGISMNENNKNGEALPDWIESIWQRYSDTIYKLCVSKCKAEEDAKDLFQTVALKFCQNAASLKERRFFFHWFSCVLNHAHCDMVAERHSTYTMSKLGGTVESLYSLPSERSVFHKFVDAPEADFESFFAVLAPLERMIVEMTYIGGFSTEEISTVIGISPNAIRKRRHFAITKMRKLCSGHE